jgi:hypothetical protein
VQAGGQIQGQRSAKVSQDGGVHLGLPATLLAPSQVSQRSAQLVVEALGIAAGCKHIQAPLRRFKAQVRQAKVVEGDSREVVGPDVGRIVSARSGRRLNRLLP